MLQYNNDEENSVGHKYGYLLKGYAAKMNDE